MKSISEWLHLIPIKELIVKLENNLKFVRRAVDLFAAQTGTIIDGTCGNGHDTKYLAEKYPQANIFAFDIQVQAIESCQERTKNSTNITYICRSHEFVSEYVTSVNVAIFNLGYLPNGNSELTTLASSTITAISEISKLLVVGGGIVITLYRGESNLEESKLVEKFVKELPKDQYIVAKYDLINLQNNPYNIVIERKH